MSDNNEHHQDLIQRAIFSSRDIRGFTLLKTSSPMLEILTDSEKHELATIVNFTDFPKDKEKDSVKERFIGFKMVFWRNWMIFCLGKIANFKDRVGRTPWYIEAFFFNKTQAEKIKINPFLLIDFFKDNLINKGDSKNFKIEEVEVKPIIFEKLINYINTIQSNTIQSKTQFLIDALIGYYDKIKERFEDFPTFISKLKRLLKKFINVYLYRNKLILFYDDNKLENLINFLLSMYSIIPPALSYKVGFSTIEEDFHLEEDYNNNVQPFIIAVRSENRYINRDAWLDRRIVILNIENLQIYEPEVQGVKNKENFKDISEYLCSIVLKLLNKQIDPKIVENLVCLLDYLILKRRFPSFISNLLNKMKLLERLIKFYKEINNQKEDLKSDYLGKFNQYLFEEIPRLDQLIYYNNNLLELMIKFKEILNHIDNQGDFFNWINAFFFNKEEREYFIFINENIEKIKLLKEKYMKLQEIGKEDLENYLSVSLNYCLGSTNEDEKILNIENKVQLSQRIETIKGEIKRREKTIHIYDTGIENILLRLIDIVSRKESFRKFTSLCQYPERLLEIIYCLKKEPYGWNVLKSIIDPRNYDEKSHDWYITIKKLLELIEAISRNMKIWNNFDGHYFLEKKENNKDNFKSLETILSDLRKLLQNKRKFKERLYDYLYRNKEMSHNDNFQEQRTLVEDFIKKAIYNPQEIKNYYDLLNEVDKEISYLQEFFKDREKVISQDFKNNENIFNSFVYLIENYFNGNSNDNIEKSLRKFFSNNKLNKLIKKYKDLIKSFKKLKETKAKFPEKFDLDFIRLSLKVFIQNEYDLPWMLFIDNPANPQGFIYLKDLVNISESLEKMMIVNKEKLIQMRDFTLEFLLFESDFDGTLSFYENLIKFDQIYAITENEKVSRDLRDLLDEILRINKGSIIKSKIFQYFKKNLDFLKDILESYRKQEVSEIIDKSNELGDDIGTFLPFIKYRDIIKSFSEIYKELENFAHKQKNFQNSNKDIIVKDLIIKKSLLNDWESTFLQVKKILDYFKKSFEDIKYLENEINKKETLMKMENLLKGEIPFKPEYLKSIGVLHDLIKKIDENCHVDDRQNIKEFIKILSQPQKLELYKDFQKFYSDFKDILFFLKEKDDIDGCKLDKKQLIKEILDRGKIPDWLIELISLKDQIILLGNNWFHNQIS
ncbi:MAG: hypothetical protein ACTSRA_10695 [Promethearchaeota archaeon]